VEVVDGEFAGVKEVCVEGGGSDEFDEKIAK
jgi:hypothetical protein